MSTRAPTDRARQLLKRLRRAGNGRRKYPIATLAFYGPDDRRASKLVASIIEREGAEPTAMQKWHSEAGDVRENADILAEAVAFVEAHGARTVVMPDRIIGCPHEEGVDYEGTVCPQCPFWAIRDRWTGEVIQ